MDNKILLWNNWLILKAHDFCVSSPPGLPGLSFSVAMYERESKGSHGVVNQHTSHVLQKFT